MNEYQRQKAIELIAGIKEQSRKVEKTAKKEGAKGKPMQKYEVYKKLKTLKTEQAELEKLRIKYIAKRDFIFLDIQRVCLSLHINGENMLIVEDKIMFCELELENN